MNDIRDVKEDKPLDPSIIFCPLIKAARAKVKNKTLKISLFIIEFKKPILNSGSALNFKTIKKHESNIKINLINGLISNPTSSKNAGTNISSEINSR